MPSFSIIVPSYNQERFIAQTLQNLKELKEKASHRNIAVQVIVVDNCSGAETQAVITNYKPIINALIIEKDKGQYDAINKGLKLVTGDYWTWLNTDDLIDIHGFFDLVDVVSKNQKLDYVYGNVAYIDEHSNFHKQSTSGNLSLAQLVNKDASISQPGSFFKTAFTKTIGELAPYHFAFDYEYILRCFKHKALVARIDSTVAQFRYYTSSKSGSKDYRFLKEQLEINQQYGGYPFSKLGLMLRLRILKRRLFN